MESFDLTFPDGWYIGRVEGKGNAKRTASKMAKKYQTDVLVHSLAARQPVLFICKPDGMCIEVNASEQKAV